MSNVAVVQQDREDGVDDESMRSPMCLLVEKMEIEKNKRDGSTSVAVVV